MLCTQNNKIQTTQTLQYSLAPQWYKSTGNKHSYLGVEICNNLKWNDHISHIAAKGNCSLG